MKSLASKFRSVSSAIRARSQQGIENLADAEAEAIVAKDRVSHGRDLLNAIEAGDFPLAPLRRPPEERH
jgi:catalase